MLVINALASGLAPNASAQEGRDADESALIKLALSRHAGLRSVQSRVRAAEARFSQESSLRPPRLSVQVMPPPSFNGSQVALMQPLERQERLDWAGRVALAEGMAARAEAVRLEAGIRQTIRTLLAERAYLREALRLLDRAQVRTREMARLASARYSVGKASQSELTQAEVRQTDLRHERIVREEELASVEARLGTLVEGDPGRPPAQAGDSGVALHVAPPAFAYPAEKLFAAGRTHAPDLLMLQAASARAEAEVEVARLDAEAPIADVGLMVGKSPGMGDPMIGASLGLDLPFLRPGRLNQARAAAGRSQEAAREAAEQARLDLRERIAVSLTRIWSLESRIRLHIAVQKPQTVLAARTAQAAYVAGQVPFSDLLDRQADLDEVERSGLRLIADHKQAVAELEAAIGVPLEEIER